ncbi:RAMP superfamily CRISPR-associated protein [Cyanobacterium aponinum]|uniref:CRISPR type III-associated protein domain-containing protein n=1 Tax=Cyanobacterium aponinum 0216 TaxID=2676140 RepID=A0A844GV95_9CHRO|nr:RAMP superfamily CRISPR-associated protein [Cyanobacterium aponinum]MTF37966.1 hypothetical protein [Cyanobacterium aponinum 0216]
MARKIRSRYKITGNLTTISPIHIGGVGGNADTDMALAVNGEGKFYLPATSLAGALRAYMATLNSKITNKIWGFQEKEGDNGHASFVIVEDAVINSAIVEIRDGVAIDRYSGTAAEGMKFDRAILPKGVTIPISLTLERDAQLSDSEWQECQNAFAQLITALEEGEIYLGGAKSRGLGRVKLYDTRIIEEDLLSPAGILDILNNQQKPVNWGKIYASGQNCQNKLNITIKWKPEGAVMVKSEGDGMAVDILPLVSGKGGSLTFVIPGSSLKGVWRSQAERIIRTVCNHSLTSDVGFSQQVTLELIKTLFGAPAELDENQNQLGYLSCLAVDDCFANIPMTSHQWASITDATSDSSLRNCLNNMGLKDTQLGYHVGIDRWTGSAAEGFLYTTLEPFGVNWENIEISLNLQRLKQYEKLENERLKKENLPPKNSYLPTLALFLLVLRDFMESKIPIGFGVNRGMGAIQVEEVKINGKGIDNDDLKALSQKPLTSFYDLDNNLLTNLNSHWQSWLNGGK